MSYKDVLRIFKLERELSDDESAFLNTLRRMTPADIEATVETLGPPVKAKSVKSNKPTRTFEKCGVCNYSRRAAHHKDESRKDYHEFVSSKPKSKRASSIAEKMQGAAIKKAEYDVNAQHCTFEIDGKVCHGSENDGIHDATMGYGGYHEFQPPLASAASGD